MVMLKERNRSRNTEKYDYVSASEDEKIRTAMDDPRTGSRYPSITHQSNLKQNGAPELNMLYRSPELRTASYSDQRDSEYDLASLAFTESDDGATDSSDEKRQHETDSYTNA